MVAGSRGSGLSGHFLRAAGTEGPGPVGDPHQQHQRQPECLTSAGTAAGKDGLRAALKASSHKCFIQISPFL